MGFQLVPTSLTLNGLERRNTLILRQFTEFDRLITSQWLIKIDL